MIGEAQIRRIDVFPARAGMSRSPQAMATGTTHVPRASGDEPDDFLYNRFRVLCSPRERG